MSVPQTSVSVLQGVAFAGMAADTAFLRDVKSYSSAESSAEIPFGMMVAVGSNPDECLIPAAQTDPLARINLHSHAFQKDHELGDTGIKPKVVLNAMTRGRVWVAVDEAVALTDAVRVRMSGSGVGTFRKTAVSGVTKACTTSA